MVSSTAKPRNSCSSSNIVLFSTNFVLFVLSAASFGPMILLRMPPTSLGLAFMMVSCISLLSAFVGFYSQLAHLCFVTHLSLLFASLLGQVFGILALFRKEQSSLSMLKSPRDPKESKLLVRLECVVLMAMGLMQVVVLVLSCAVHRHYEGVEGGKKRVARESMEGKELDEKMKSKYGQWV